MATVEAKQLGTWNGSSSGSHSLYTPPSGKLAVVKCVTAMNHNSSGTEISVYVTYAGVDRTFWENDPLPGFTSRLWQGWVVVPYGYTLNTYVGNAYRVDVMAYGVEITP